MTTNMASVASVAACDARVSRPPYLKKAYCVKGQYKVFCRNRGRSDGLEYLDNIVFLRVRIHHCLKVKQLKRLFLHVYTEVNGCMASDLHPEQRY